VELADEVKESKKFNDEKFCDAKLIADFIAEIFQEEAVMENEKNSKLLPVPQKKDELVHFKVDKGGEPPLLFLVLMSALFIC